MNTIGMSVALSPSHGSDVPGSDASDSITPVEPLRNDGGGLEKQSHIAELSGPHARSAAVLALDGATAALTPPALPSTGLKTISLDELARQIAVLGTDSSVGHVLRLGELVYQGLYGSSRALQSDAGAASLRRLAAHPQVAWKVTSLWRAVSVYELSLRLPQLFDLPGLGVSHFRAVLGLPPHVQESLLQSAAEEKWTKRRLESEALRFRTERPRRGRRPLSNLEKWTRDAAQLLEQLTELRGKEASKELSGDPAELREVRAHLTRLRAVCDELEAQLAAR